MVFPGHGTGNSGRLAYNLPGLWSPRQPRPARIAAPPASRRGPRRAPATARLAVFVADDWHPRIAVTVGIADSASAATRAFFLAPALLDVPADRNRPAVR